MRNRRGLPVFLTVAVTAIVVLAAVLVAAGTVSDWIADAAGAVGALLLGVVILAAAVLAWSDVVRSAGAGEYVWAGLRMLLAAGFVVGMWHGLTEEPDAWFYLLCLFGALVALALMFLFALAKSPGASVEVAETRAAAGPGVVGGVAGGERGPLGGVAGVEHGPLGGVAGVERAPLPEPIP